MARLSQRYPRATAGVVHALSLALVVALASDYTVLAAAAWLALFLGFAWWKRDRPLPLQQEPEPEWTAVDWFEDVCRRARVPLPLVKADWPTSKGHAYRLLITEWVEREGRPMTVGAWLDFCPLLRDVAGMGCKYVAPMPDADNGGIATVEFQGVHFGEPEPEPQDDTPHCCAEGCATLATLHFLANSEQDWFYLCAEHAGKIRHDHYLERHPILAACTEDGYWHPATEDHPSRCGPDVPAIRAVDESDRKCTPDSEPLSPQVILHIVDGEGSGVGGSWPAPVGPPAPAPVKRPPGATEGSKAGRMFDLLANAQGPLRRGSLAEFSGLSPTTVDKHLTAWADLGAVSKVGQLWQIASEYSDACTLIPCGREEDAGE